MEAEIDVSSRDFSFDFDPMIFCRYDELLLIDTQTFDRGGFFDTYKVDFLLKEEANNGIIIDRYYAT